MQTGISRMPNGRYGTRESPGYWEATARPLQPNTEPTDTGA